MGEKVIDMSKNIILVLIYSIIFTSSISCSSNKENCSEFSFEDSIYISKKVDSNHNSTINQYIKGAWSKYYLKDVLNVMYVGSNRYNNITSDLFIIKECINNGEKIHVFKRLEPFSWFDILEYEGLTRGEKSKLISLQMYQVIEFSEYYWNLHNYRLINKEYEYYIENKIKNDIDTFETFINNLQVLKVNDLTYSNRIGLIRDLFITMYFQEYFLQVENAYPFTHLYLLNQRNLRYIDREEELLSFIELTNNDSIEEIPLAKSEDEVRQYYLLNGKRAYPINDTDSRQEIKLYFTLENKKYLKQKISAIKKDYFEDNVFYFYSLPDIKLFRLEIRYDKLKGYSLIGEYMNHQFIWPNFNHVTEPVFFD
ncbi:MAG: hypothetical protein IIA45_13920 [Bacteroidetes bacterium]|nr:hypothetical protein [Bacteroidota bacterium]